MSIKDFLSRKVNLIKMSPHLWQVSTIGTIHSRIIYKASQLYLSLAVWISDFEDLVEVLSTPSFHASSHKCSSSFLPELGAWFSSRGGLVHRVIHPVKLMASPLYGMETRSLVQTQPPVRFDIRREKVSPALDSWDAGWKFIALSAWFSLQLLACAFERLPAVEFEFCLRHIDQVRTNLV